MTFKDHFSTQAAAYAEHRPSYPSALFRYLAGLTPKRGVAWDCGTGSGQAALGLASYFEHVVATDPSASQIRHALAHDRVTYSVASAERCPLRSGTVDLVAVAQALHWFDVDVFYGEVRRVLKPEGLIAVWCYGLFRVSPALDPLLHAFYENIGPYWPPERRFIEERYETLPFPFQELNAPPFFMEAQWSLGQLLGYLRTWSATQRCKNARAADPVSAIEEALATAWGEGGMKSIRWPIYIRIGALQS